MPTRRRFQLRAPKDTATYGEFKAGEVYKIPDDQTALIALFEGFVTDGDADDLDAVVNPDNVGALLGVTDINGFGFGRRNAIINGGMVLAQRGDAYTSGKAIDRWELSNTTSGARITDVPANKGFLNSLQFIRSSAGNTTAAQKVGAAMARTLMGQKVAVSLWARSADGVGALALNFRTANAANNFAATTLRAAQSLTGGAALATAWTRYTYVFPAAVTDIANGFIVEFERTGPAASETRITGVQVEPVSVTEYEHENLFLERILCQRYFRRIGRVSGSALNATVINLTHSFEAPMRVAPSVSIASGISSVSVRMGGSSSVTISSPTLSDVNADVDGVSLLLQTAAGLTANQEAQVLTAAWLDFDAEF